MNNLLPQIIAIARQAGHAIMAIYADPANDVMTKEDNSPLTQADLASDRVISAGLARLGLGWPVLSEESAQIPYAERQNWQRFWLVDPLDGTREFIKRNGEFTINIAPTEPIVLQLASGIYRLTDKFSPRCGENLRRSTTTSDLHL